MLLLAEALKVVQEVPAVAVAVQVMQVFMFPQKVIMAAQVEAAAVVPVQ
jgi:hypothetical protein